MNRVWRNISGWLLLGLLALAGCWRTADPIDARLAEIGYTPELLVAELEQRLTYTAPKAPRGELAKPSAAVAVEDADRGTDSERPDPHDFGVIVADAAQKIQAIQQRRENARRDILAETLALLDASSALDAETKRRVETALQQVESTSGK